LDCRFEVAYDSIVGKSSKTNEDSIAGLRFSHFVEGKKVELMMLALADGVGGEPAGERASALAITVVCKRILNSFAENPNGALANLGDGTSAIIKEANQAVYKESTRDPLYAGMASTLTYIILSRGSCQVGHIGDCRCYIIRNQSISQLTEDQNSQGSLLQYLGTNSIPKPFSKSFRLEDNDLVLLCCDGLTKFVQDEQILKIASKSKSCERVCSNLIRAAVKAGGTDDISVGVVKVEIRET
jgi:serine/threonine protein phosphatase PrpC